MRATVFWTILLLVIAAALLAGCTVKQAQPVQPAATPVTMPAPVATPSSDTVRLADTALGTILVDSSGKTLYYFADDIPWSNTSACGRQCAAVWPVFSAGAVRVSPPLDPSAFGTITRADGTAQTTYNGRPLYYYQADTNPGDVKGENIINAWFVMKPDETVMIAHRENLGSYLTDSSGKTLYFFSNDAPGSTPCSGACLVKWPPFRSTSISAPSVLNASDFSIAKRSDGITQTAFMNHLLYYYSGDAGPGDTNGQGLNGAWYVAKITGTVPSPQIPVVTMVPGTTATSDNSNSGTSTGGY
ncbi:MAG TPA: hypothetical protein VHN82_07700 [Methanoregula sp.]|nr:hypothetical protein [Methanoregula sp.]